MLLDVEIEVNTTCNLSCSYCPSSLASKGKDEEMSDKVFVRIVSELSKLQFKGRLCYHFYGEPLLFSSLERFLDYSVRKLPKVSNAIFTNGVLLTKERLFSLFNAGAKFFIVTKQEQVDKLEIEEYLDELPADLRKRIIFRKHTEMDKTNRGGSLPSLTPEIGLPLKRSCCIPLYAAFFNVKGDVLFCHEDWAQNYKLGNILKNDLETIREGKEFNSMCSELKKGNRSVNSVCSLCSSKQLLPL